MYQYKESCDGARHQVTAGGEYHSIVLNALPALADHAQTKVPSSISYYWGHALGWPTWLREGSSLAGSGPLPRYISFIDDAIIVANLLDHVGPTKLLSSTLGDAQLPFSGSSTRANALSAPDILSMLQGVSKLIGLQNPHLNVWCTAEDEYCCVFFAGLPLLREIGSFVEHCGALYFLRIAEQYHSSLSEDRSAQTARPVIELRHATPDLLRLLAGFRSYVFQASPTVSCLRIPDAWCRERNPSHDPEAWAELNEVLRGLEGSLTQEQWIAGLRNTIRRIVRYEHRMPRIQDIADREGISERTVFRRLAQSTISFRQLSEEVRQEEAKRMLADTSLSIAWIAKVLGYSNSASFGRAFRRWHKITPTTARRAMVEHGKTEQWPAAE